MWLAEELSNQRLYNFRIFCNRKDDRKLGKVYYYYASEVYFTWMWVFSMKKFMYLFAVLIFCFVIYLFGFFGFSFD